MNAYEIEQIEKDVKASFRLPLSFEGWADIERRAREERARVLGEGIAGFFATAWAKLKSTVRVVRSTAADCTSARLHHS
jgi:threonine dehydrogenase-like Zn-dependent dehydrogenase